MADQSLETLAGLLNDQASRVTPDGKNALAVLIADLKLNTFLLADADGRIVFSRGYDEETQTLTSPPRGLFPHLTPDNPLLRHPNAESSLTGLVFIPEGPLLVASEYILSSQGGGILGTVIMGRFLDDEEIRQLSELTRLSLVVHRLDGSDMPEDFQDALSTVSDETPVAVRTLDDNLVAGYTVLPDIQGEPGMIMRVDVPRDIMDKGRLSMLYLLISLVAVGLVMVALILFLLDKLVLSRLLRLSGEVSGIQSASGCR